MTLDVQYRELQKILKTAMPPLCLTLPLNGIPAKKKEEIAQSYET